MAAKKCNCKKCGYCKQLCTGFAVYKTNCEKYGEIYMPNYCDKFITIEEYEREQRIKRDYELQVERMERFWKVIEKWENK